MKAGAEPTGNALPKQDILLIRALKKLADIDGFVLSMIGDEKQMDHNCTISR